MFDSTPVHSNCGNYKTIICRSYHEELIVTVELPLTIYSVTNELPVYSKAGQFQFRYLIMNTKFTLTLK